MSVGVWNPQPRWSLYEWRRSSMTSSNHSDAEYVSIKSVLASVWLWVCDMSVSLDEITHFSEFAEFKAESNGQICGCSWFPEWISITLILYPLESLANLIMQLVQSCRYWISLKTVKWGRNQAINLLDSAPYIIVLAVAERWRSLPLQSPRVSNKASNVSVNSCLVSRKIYNTSLRESSEDGAS